MTTFLLTTQIILAVILTIVILFQKSSSIGLGAYSGTNESVFGAKGPANFLSKLTFFFGFLFIVNTITLGYLYNKEGGETVLDTVSIVPTVADETKSSSNATIPTAPTIPTVPTAPTIPTAK